MQKIMWEASTERKAKSNMKAFAEFASRFYERDLFSWKSLYSWSIKEKGEFWSALAQFAKVKWQKTGNEIYIPPLGQKMLGAKWFPDFTLNFAENLLPPPSAETKVVSLGENGEKKIYSALKLHNEVATFASSLKACGVKKGDVVCGVLNHEITPILAMLATTSLGAVWSSCSPEFGKEGISQRLEQIKPKVLFYTLEYQYQGKKFSTLETLDSCLTKLSTRPIVVGVHKGHAYDEFLALSNLDLNSASPLPIDFTPCAFSDPLYILFSSGTTGAPKCIVHSIGGTILQHKKELLLHSDIQKKDVLFYYTSCAWMMWNWMASTLACGASLVTYDGSATYPNINRLWEIVEEEKVSVFGTSAKFIASTIQQNFIPQHTYKFESLKTILTTGSPLLPEHYDWVYENVKKNVHLASISGGTDIVSCFMLGNPLLPVRRGEIQSPGLGMEIACYSDEGKNLVGEKGELVCLSPFVAMPIYFLHDLEGKKYHETYFEYFLPQEIWRHGDYVEITEEGGIKVYGRSDTTLKPSGVRIGTAEIYQVTEKIPFLLDSVAVGYPHQGDCLVLLFVVLDHGKILTSEMKDKIKKAIRTELSPRHVPWEVYAVGGIPYTPNGKKQELSVLRFLTEEKAIEVASDSWATAKEGLKGNLGYPE